MCRFALLMLLASSFTIATFSSPDSLSLDKFDSSLWPTIGKEELSSTDPMNSFSGRPKDHWLVPVTGSGDTMASYQDQDFTTEDAGQGTAGIFGNRPVTGSYKPAALFGFDLLSLAATADENSQQYQSNSPADESCGSVTDVQTPGTPTSSWSTPDPDLVQKRDPALVCPAPPNAVGIKRLRPEQEIEPNIPRGEPDDSRNYGGPNARLRVPGGEEDDQKRCASQKTTLCCMGPADLPRVVRNCFRYDVSNEVCEDYQNIYCCRRTDFRYRTRMLNRLFNGAGFGYVCTYLFQIYNPRVQSDP